MPGSASQETAVISDQANRIVASLDSALEKLASTPDYAKGNHVGWVLDQARKLLGYPEGPGLLFKRAGRLDTAGLFAGTDWESPDTLQARFVPITFEEGDARLIAL